MFGRRKASDSYKGGRQEAGSRSGRFSSARRAETARDWSRAAASSGRTSGKSARNKRLKQEKAPKESSLANFCDWGRVRLWTVGACFLILGCGLWARAYHLQINMGPEYAAMAKRQHTAKEVIQGVRGNILDRNGNIMAQSVECNSIWANPSQIQDKDAAASKLAKALRLPVRKVRALLGEKKKSFVWLSRKVDYHTAEAVKALGISGVYMDAEYERVYPYKHLAGQLIGFVNIDDKGIEGLEKSLESSLAGRSVTQVVERDAAGRRLMPLGAGNMSDLRGQDVRLTIDTQVQFFAEEALAEHVVKFGARWGGCIVVDVPTGDVLAWAQYPFFDPNNVGATPQADRRNRLSTDMLEQGSTIKSFLLAAALEEKVVNPATEIFCENGRWKFRRFTLHDTHSYGNLSVEKILHVSSNIGAAKIGLMLGARRYYDYLTRLGFGNATQLPLASEAKGILRDAKRWADIDLATASFGQSFSTTLAQMAQAYMCLAGDGGKRPLRLLVDDSIYCRVTGLQAAADGNNTNASASMFSTKAYASDTPEQGNARADTAPRDRIFSPETLRTVRNMLREVVEEDGGTGKQARVPGIEVGGKTGTAQKADASGRYGKGRVGSFVGMLPIDNPRFLVCVLLDEPTKVQYGGVIAAPVFRHVAQKTMAYHGLLPDVDLEALQAAAKEKQQAKKGKAGKKNAAKAPEKAVKNKTVPVALAVADKEPNQADAVPAVPEPPVYDATQMPGVVGMGLRNAVEVFAARGVMPVIKGKGGIVVRQHPEAGTPWPEDDSDMECVLWLEEGA